MIYNPPKLQRDYNVLTNDSKSSCASEDGVWGEEMKGKSNRSARTC